MKIIFKQRFGTMPFNNEHDRLLGTFNKKGEILGTFRWENKWHEWVWEQSYDVMMSIDCLKQIINKMQELNLKKKRIKVKSARGLLDAC